MKNQKRILSRILAKELTPEELEQVAGSADSQKPQRPPISTLAATLPDYSEDQ